MIFIGGGITDSTQAAAELRRRGVHWPHLSPDDRVALERDCPEAMAVLLAGVPDDSEIEVVTKIDEKTDEVVAKKKMLNPMPMYARLGFGSMSSLSAEAAKLGRKDA